MSLNLLDRPVKTPRARDGGPLSSINADGYEVVGAMAHQRDDLREISDVNSLEDQARATLGAILRELQRVLRGSRPDAGEARHLAEQALRWHARVDILDAEQGLDARQPVARATRRNSEAASAGRRIIAATEPVKARRNGHNTGEAA